MDNEQGKDALERKLKDTPNFAGVIQSKKLNRLIAVFRKKGESTEDALKRVSKAHE